MELSDVRRTPTPGGDALGGPGLTARFIVQCCDTPSAHMIFATIQSAGGAVDTVFTELYQQGM